MSQTRRAAALKQLMRVAGRCRNFLKTLYGRPRARKAAYFARRATWGPFSPNSDRPRGIRVNGAHPTRGAPKQLLRVTEKSRDFTKLLRNRPLGRGVAYFLNPLHVGPIFAESRQIQRNQSKRRKPAARVTWVSF